MLIALFYGCFLTGLLTYEWFRATLSHNGTLLPVKNAKATNGLGNDSQRALYLINFL